MAVARPRRPRVYRQRRNPLDYYDDMDFQARYRLTKDVVRNLALQYSNSEFIGTTGDPRAASISYEERFCLGLRYLATGANYSTIADLQGVSRSTLCRAVREVISFLCDISPHHIRWPVDDEELHTKAREFYTKSGKPCTVGCIDGSQIAIKCPAEGNEGVYVNRKAYHSINVMIISDANLKITSLDERFPGSVHDAFVVRASSIYDYAEAGSMKGYWLLGDSGYPLLPWLFTPIRVTGNAKEDRFNRWHKATRSSVERTIGLLKQRWRCIDHSAGYLVHDPQTSAKIIRACVVLHNIARDNAIPLRVDDDPDGQIPAQRRQFGVRLMERLRDNPDDPYNGEPMAIPDEALELGGIPIRTRFINCSFRGVRLPQPND